MKNHISKRIIAFAAAAAICGTTVPFVFASDLNGTKTIVCDEGDNLTVGGSAETADETQRLIDARPDIRRRMDDMGRGLVAVKTDNGVFVSWRWEGTESLNVKYNLYKNGVKINSEPMILTNYTDNEGTAGDKYSVSAVTDGVEGEKCAEVSVWDDGYLEIPLNKPETKSWRTAATQLITRPVTRPLRILTVTANMYYCGAPVLQPDRPSQFFGLCSSIPYPVH